MKRRSFIQSAFVTAAAVSVDTGEVFGSVARPIIRQQQLPDVDAVTGDGQQVTLTGKALSDLRARLRGKLLLAGNPGYDDARRILNPSFDKRPALIVQPTGVADIRSAVDFAREHRGLLLAVKCGGHSSSGQSTCDKGMQIDLSLFRDVRVDPTGRRVWVTGGSLLGSVDHESMAYNLATTMGTVSHTGVGGLVTGGGFGRLGRRFGLAIDNLLSVDVVGADGQFRHASKDENADLFWGVRGGGGNFGIVTNFEFRLHPMQRQVFNGRIMYPLARAREVLTVYGEYGRTAPDELDLGWGMVLPPNNGEGMCGFSLCYSGPPSGLDRALAPLLKLGTPVANNVAALDYVAVQRSGDVTDPRAMAVYLKSGFVTAITPDLISAMVERFRGHPARATQIFTQMGLGAIGRVAPDATAFSQRDIHSNLLCSAVYPMGTPPEEHIAAIRQLWAGIEPHTHGFYVNDLDPNASAANVKANYRSNHDRLLAVKNKYDPKNLFRLNANVKPTAG